MVYLNDGDKDKGSNTGHHHVQLHVGLVLVVEAAPLLATGHGGNSLACVQVVLKMVQSVPVVLKKMKRKSRETLAKTS